MKREYNNWILVILLILTLWLIKVTHFNIEETTVTNKNNFYIENQYNKIHQSRGSKGKDEYLFTGTVNHHWYSQNKVTIIPDDCLNSVEVNNILIDLTYIPESSRCNIENGFILNLGSYLTNGKNQIKFKLLDYGGAYKIFVRPTIADPIYLFLFILLVNCIIILFLQVLKYFQVTGIIAFILVGGLLIRIIYLSYTDYFIRSHDIGGHLDYIQYLTNNYSLPHPDQCWECHNQPLYYILAALISKICQFLSINNDDSIYQILQWISLFIFMGFLVTIVRLYQKIFTQHYLFLIASILLVYSPSVIVHSVRISNDILFYFFYALSFYFVCLWWRYEDNFHYFSASLFALLCIFTKTNGIIIVVLIFSCLFIKSIIQKKKPNLKLIIASILTFFIICFITFYQPIYYPSDGSWVVRTSVGLNNALIIENKAYKLIYFDLQSFLMYPNINPWIDEGGRQYFLNYLLKTSLFGEFSIKNKVNINLAFYLSLSLLVILIYSVYGALKTNKKETIKLIPFWLNFWLSLFALIYFRHSFHQVFACNQDFRLILPISISPIVFYVIALKNNSKFPVIMFIGYFVPIIFSLLSITFFLVPLFSYPLVY